MRGFLTKTFLKGLSVILPVVVAIYLLIWLVGGVEQNTRQLLTAVLPAGWYLPGLGFALFTVAVFFAGLLMYPFVTRKLLAGFDALLRRIPLISTIYSPVKDFMDMIGGDMAQELGQPVLINVPHSKMRTLGFITRENDGGGLPDGVVPDDHLVVFVQWSSQIGGYTFVVHRDQVERLDMTVEEALRWAVTAGLSGKSAITRSTNGTAKDRHSGQANQG